MVLLAALLTSCSVYKPIPIEQVCTDALYAYAAALRQCTDDEALINKRYLAMKDKHTCRVQEYIGEGFEGDLDDESDIDLTMLLEDTDTDSQPTYLQVDDAYACARAVSGQTCDEVLSATPDSTWLEQADRTCAMLFSPPEGATEWVPPTDDTDTDTDTPIDTSVDWHDACDRTGMKGLRNETTTFDATLNMTRHADAERAGDGRIDVIAIELWHGRGATGSPIYGSAETWQYADCATCVLACEGYPENAALGDWGRCRRVYLGGAGNLDVLSNPMAVGGVFAGELRSIYFQEVTWNNGTTSYQDGGKLWCLDDHAFNQTIE